MSQSAHLGHDSHNQQAHQHGRDAGHESDQAALPDLLDLDAAALAEPLRAVRADIAALVDAPVRSILDLGAGTGTGTFGLLEQFPVAHVLAVDGSAEMVERLQRRAEQLGVADRVTTRQADLDVGVPDGDPVDLTWASAALHHLADPDRTLAQVVARIRPGGLLAVVELTGFPRFLPDGTDSTDGTDGTVGGAAEASAHAMLAADRAIDLPAMGSDWAPRLARAGLVVELDRAIVVDLAPAQAPRLGDYAFATLTRIRSALAGRLAAADVVQLDRLLDGGPDDVRRRDDLRVRTERRLCVARRPVG